MNEIDVILRRGSNLIPIEIKSAKTFNFSFLKGLKYFQKLTKRCQNPTVIYAGKEEQMVDKIKVMNFSNAKKAII